MVSGRCFWHSEGSHPSGMSLQRHHALLVPPGCKHWEGVDAEGTAIAWWAFVPMEALPIERIASRPLAIPAPMKVLETQLLNSMHSGFDTYRAVFLEAIITQLLVTWLRTCQQADADLPMQRARALLCDPEMHSIGAIAKASGMSVASLRRAFVTRYGMSPLAYRDHQRLRMANALLAAEHLQVQEVAQRCGFRDAAYFSRWFRKHMGYAPRFKA